MRIGLTGGSGVLGRTLRESFSEIDWVIFTGDIRDFAAVQQWLYGAGDVDAIIHMAAMVPTAMVESQPLKAFQTNVSGTCNLLEAIRQHTSHAAPWLFLASTSHVYASSEELLDEESPLSPVSMYGLTKLQSEEWGRIYASKYNLPVCMGRIFSYSSPLQPDSYFVPGLVKKIRNAGPNVILQIPGLNGTRDFLMAKQICEAVMHLFQQRTVGVFNIGTGKSVKLSDVATMVRDKLSRNDVTIELLGNDAVHLNANVNKLQKTGLILKPELELLLEEIIIRRA